MCNLWWNTGIADQMAGNSMPTIADPAQCWCLQMASILGKRATARKPASLW